MSKLNFIPAFIAAHPRLFWGGIILLVFGWLVMSCGFTFLPQPVMAVPTPEPTLAAPTATSLPPARQNLEFVVPTATPLPQEWFSTPDQTMGIILGASILLLVILIGTLIAMSVRQKSR